MTDYLMPSLGADMKDGRVVEWHVRPGDTVRRGDVVGVVDTEKGAIEIEIWENGVVREILVEPGTKVPVGEALFRYEREAEPPIEPFAPAEAPRVSPPAPAEPRAPSRPTIPAVTVPAVPGVRASPAARRRARELGIDLSAVAGSGPGGAVILEDLLGHAEGVEKRAPETTAPKTASEGMRAAIAAAMSRSKRDIPHYYLGSTVSLQKATDWLAAQNRERAPDARVLPVALTLKAVALAAREFPEMNGHWIEGALRPAERVHTGLAISLRTGGLIAPAIHDADEKTLDALTAAVSDLVQRARSGRLRSSEITDATLTVSSLGDRGVDRLYGVIYPPQVALVGVGRPVHRPWVMNGAVVVHSVVEITLSGDHRASDGHRGGLFLERIGDLLQRPEEL